ncbi:ATP-binding protein [Odoribacter sp. OttesenSCG-928-J03]|nr:ATP-binding protein [Odoribacter sp. OttesenSCG-928-J03]
MKDLSSHIMDIAQNSVRAEANKIEISIQEDIQKDILSIVIIDNGSGMDEETLKRVSDPFFTSRTVRKVGLGIPLLKQNAERTEGSFTITSKKGEGTTVNVLFKFSHLDRPPMGDIAETIALLASANPDIHLIYKHTTNDGQYIFDTEEVKKILDGVPINMPEIVLALMDMIRGELKELGMRS